MMLPPNVTAVIQPMDQNPIKILKLKYRNMLLMNVLAQTDSVHDALTKHSIKHAILLLKAAWDEMPQSVLKNAWSKILNWDEKEYEDEDNIPVSMLLPNPVYDELIIETRQLLSQIAVDTTISTEEIETWNADIINDEADCVISSGSDDECEHQVDPPIPYGEALNAVNTLIKWATNDMQYESKHMSSLLTLRTDIVKKHFTKPQKQTKLNDFFAKK